MSRAGVTAARAPLPVDPDECPPLDPAFDATLDGALEALGVRLDPAQRSAIRAHVRLLLAWNTAINLTAIRTAPEVALEHVADALTAVDRVRSALATAAAGDRPTALVDLGSGGGMPGLPLGLAIPIGRVSLVDSVAKKARFMAVAGEAAHRAMVEAGAMAPDIEAIADRAESLAADPAYRGAFDVATVRALGSLAESVELALPLLRPGGLLVVWKRDATPPAAAAAVRAMAPADSASVMGDQLAAELTAAEPIVRAIGGRLEAVVAVTLAGLEDHRLVLVGCASPAPSRYPRSPTERRRDGR